MKKNLSCIALLCISAVTVVGELNPDNRYTVIFEHTVVEANPLWVPENFEPKTLDLSSITVHVLRVADLDGADDSSEELASKDLVNGKAIVEGELSKPTAALILVKSNEEILLSTRTVIKPRDVISIAILDHQGPYPSDQLALVGSSSQVTDSRKKFTILGNFSTVDTDLSLTTARAVRQGEYDGNVDYGTVLLSDGCFQIEGEVAEPTVVYVKLNTGMEGSGYFGWTFVVVEPGSVIRIAPITPERVWSRGTLLSSAGVGKHVQLVESWRRSQRYRNLLDAFALALEELDQEKAARQSRAESGESGTDSPIEESEIYKHKEELANRVFTFGHEAIDRIARTSNDPVDVLLALEMGAFRYGPDSLPIFEKLERSLDEDIVARRVTPAKDALIARLQAAANRHSLVSGEKAPDFTLPDLSGERVSLNEVVDGNELVLIDFWASWCGPCIAEMPDLKQVYKEFGPDGFEVITVSIDDSFDDWEETSTQLQLPWKNVADIGGFHSTTPTAYGVLYLPKKYLIDDKGLITHVDPSTDQLQELLEARYGATNSGD